MIGGLGFGGFGGLGSGPLGRMVGGWFGVCDVQALLMLIIVGCFVDVSGFEVVLPSRSYLKFTKWK